MLPASQIISQIRESASLKVEDLEKRINEFDVASASPGVRRAAGVLATPGLQRIKGATPEAAQLAAAALGVGYATGAGDTRTFRRNWHDTNQRSSGGDRSGAPVGLRGWRRPCFGSFRPGGRTHGRGHRRESGRCSGTVAGSGNGSAGVPGRACRADERPRTRPCHVGGGTAFNRWRPARHVHTTRPTSSNSGRPTATSN